MDQNISPSISIQSVQAQIKAQASSAKTRAMRQESAKFSFTEWSETGVMNSVKMRQEFKTLKDFKKDKKRGKEETKKSEIEEESVITDPGELENAADSTNKENPELLKKSLLLLKSTISKNDSAEDILKKVLDFYPDKSLADDALNFLLKTSSGNLANKIQLAKDNLNEHFQREIVAGKNIATQAREFSKEGLGSPTALRDIYRDVTGTPRTANTLFEEFSKVFSFTKMKSVISFLLHSLGSDLKSKGPSIARPELEKLISDARSLQAILGVYKFFKGRMGLISKQFSGAGLMLPGRINFELIAKQFMSLLSNRYISPEKVISLAKILGISEELLAQIIIFTQMRDAVRQTAPKLYKTKQHKEEVLSSLIEAIEEIDNELEDEGNGREEEDEEEE